jgi:excisionase family DNA binding protein
MNSGKFLTGKQAAEKLGFTPEYIRHLCNTGKIEAQKLGNTWVLSLDILKKLKRKRKRKESCDASRSNK